MHTLDIIALCPSYETRVKNTGWRRGGGFQEIWGAFCFCTDKNTVIPRWQEAGWSALNVTHSHIFYWIMLTHSGLRLKASQKWLHRSNLSLWFPDDEPRGHLKLGVSQRLMGTFWFAQYLKEFMTEHYRRNPISLCCTSCTADLTALTC